MESDCPARSPPWPSHLTSCSKKSTSCRHHLHLTHVELRPCAGSVPGAAGGCYPVEPSPLNSRGGCSRSPRVREGHRAIRDGTQASPTEGAEPGFELGDLALARPTAPRLRDDCGWGQGYWDRPVECGARGPDLTERSAPVGCFPFCFPDGHRCLLTGVWGLAQNPF